MQKGKPGAQPKVAAASPSDEQGASPKSQSEAATEAMVAATKVLQNMQVASLRVASCWPEVSPRLSQVAREQPELGLLDSGATHALRQAKPGEWSQSVGVAVKLAIGRSSNLRVNNRGTLLTQEPTQPIAPLGLIIRVLRCKLTWGATGCHLIHPTKGRLPVSTQGGCPELPAHLVLGLISELEEAHDTHVHKREQLATLMSEEPQAGSHKDLPNRPG